jgi:hypothetical protein
MQACRATHAARGELSPRRRPHRRVFRAGRSARFRQTWWVRPAAVGYLRLQLSVQALFLPTFFVSLRIERRLPLRQYVTSRPWSTRSRASVFNGRRSTEASDADDGRTDRSCIMTERFTIRRPRIDDIAAVARLFRTTREACACPTYRSSMHPRRILGSFASGYSGRLTYGSLNIRRSSVSSATEWAGLTISTCIPIFTRVAQVPLCCPKRWRLIQTCSYGCSRKTQLPSGSTPHGASDW